MFCHWFPTDGQLSYAFFIPRLLPQPRDCDDKSTRRFGASLFDLLIRARARVTPSIFDPSDLAAYFVVVAAEPPKIQTISARDGGNLESLIEKLIFQAGSRRNEDKTK